MATKNLSRQLAVFVLAMSLGPLMAGCPKDDTPPDDDGPIQIGEDSVTVSPPTLVVVVGSPFVLDVSVRATRETGDNHRLTLGDLPPGVSGSGLTPESRLLTEAVGIGSSDYEFEFVCDDVVPPSPVFAVLFGDGDGPFNVTTTSSMTIECVAAEPPTLTLSPSEESVAVGESFTITARVQGGGDFIYVTDLPPEISWLGGGVDPEDGFISDPHEEEFTFSCSAVLAPSPLTIELQWGPAEEFIRESATVECFAPLCGNDVVNDPEQCDGADLDGETCESLGFFSGDLRCATECTFDTSNCTDPPASICGDLLVEGLEQCDDGNSDPNDGCDQYCQWECGNGMIDVGEGCDDSNRDDGDGCDSMCQSECGNGSIDGSEECDDGNADNNDGCDSTCLTEPVCGNAMVESFEACDGVDLNMMTCMDLGYAGGNLACDLLCAFDETGCLDSVCGDGLITGSEVCDGTVLGGSDCTSIGMGFDGGTLGCNSTCDAYETGSCTSPVTGCTYTFNETGIGVQAVAAGNMVDVTTETSSFTNDHARIDENCLGALLQAINDSSPFYPSATDAGSIAGFHRFGPSVLFHPDDGGGSYGPEVDIGVGVGFKIHATGLDTSHGVYAASSLHQVDAAGSVLASYTLFNTSSVALRDVFAHETAGMMHAAVYVEKTSAPFEARIEAGTATQGTGTIAMTPTTRNTAAWPDAASEPIVDVVELSDGSLQEWVQLAGASTITVTTLASGTLNPIATATVTPTGAALTDFKVGADTNGVYLFAIVDEMGTQTARLFRFADRPSGMFDATGGVEVSSAPQLLFHSLGSGVDVVVVYREGGQLIVMRQPYSAFP